MEVKINKEIRNYTESMFFGLSLRQFIFSVLACGVAVGLYFLLRPRFGTETLSWVCILGAFPFAAMGFIKYNGMTAEQFVWAWIKSEFLMPKKLMFLPDNAAYIKDSMVAELCELNRNMMLSVDIIPVPTDEAVREVENRLLGVETNITNWQRKQNQNNNFSAVIPYDLEQQRKESKEFLDDLTIRDQRMMFAVLTMVHTADSKEQLDNDTEALLTTARKHLCQFAVLKYQQMDGLNTALPFGVRKIDALRTLTTESLIGVGTALRGVWNGVPALCLGVPTNVAISKAGLSQNSQAAWTVQIGLRVTDNGKTEAMSRRQAILSFLIGKATEKPTM